MDFQQLKYFVRVAELGGFARAADLLGVAQPTLSRQIRALEIEVKSSLFYRTGRGILLTPSGARFLNRAQGLLHAAESALLELRQDDGRLSGRVVCGLTPSVGRLMTREYVARFRKQLPLASLSIMSQLSMALHDQVRASRLDFAILHNPPASPALSSTSLGMQDLYLMGRQAVGKSHSTVPLKALHQLPLVMPSVPHATRKPLELEAGRLGITLDVFLEIDQIESLFQLVSDGVAHTVATGIAAQTVAARSKLVVQRIVSPNLSSELSLVTPAQRNLTPLQAAAAELALETFNDLIATDVAGQAGKARRRA